MGHMSSRARGPGLGAPVPVGPGPPHPPDPPPAGSGRCGQRHQVLPIPPPRAWPEGGCRAVEGAAGSPGGSRPPSGRRICPGRSPAAARARCPAAAEGFREQGQPVHARQWQVSGQGQPGGSMNARQSPRVSGQRFSLSECLPPHLLRCQRVRDAGSVGQGRQAVR